MNAQINVGYALGIDLGTSGVKLCLIDAKGAAIAAAERGYPRVSTAPGMAEQDTRLWARAIADACSELLAHDPAARSRIRAVGLSAQMPTLVLTDRTGRALSNAVTWQDSRADAIGEALLSRFGQKRHFAVTGVRLDGRYIVPMYLYQKKLGFARTDALLLSAKDYIYALLTGMPATDPSTASGFGVYSLQRGAFDDLLLAKAGVDASMLPPVFGSTEAPASLDAQGAELLGLDPGIPVILGCADSICGALAMGAARDGVAAAIWGTSTALIAPSSSADADIGCGCFITPSVYPGEYALEADMLSTGLSFAWLGRLLGRTPDELLAMAQNVPAGSCGVRFYPYLAGGEQSVLWDGSLRGEIRGLEGVHTAAHIARALAEGICYETRRCTEAFSASGARITRMVCSGHAAASSFFMQLLSDIIGLECDTTPETNGSAYGAATLAGIGAGFWDAQGIPSPDAVNSARFEPDAEAAEGYSALYNEYLSKA